MADITGSDVVGTARVLVELDTSKVASQFGGIQQKLSTTGAAPMEKAGVNHGKSYLYGFTKEFKKSTMAFSKIATGLKAALKVISAPAIGFATYGVHELMKSSSVAGDEARKKWEEFHASFKKNAIRVGDILINKEIMGKTIDEWGRKLNQFLANLTSTQINKFIDTIKSMATAIVELTVAMKAMKFTGGVLSGLVQIANLFATINKGNQTIKALNLRNSLGASFELDFIKPKYVGNRTFNPEHNISEFSYWGSSRERKSFSNMQIKAANEQYIQYERRVRINKANSLIRAEPKPLSPLQNSIMLNFPYLETASKIGLLGAAIVSLGAIAIGATSNLTNLKDDLQIFKDGFKGIGSTLKEGSESFLKSMFSIGKWFSSNETHSLRNLWNRFTQKTEDTAPEIDANIIKGEAIKRAREEARLKEKSLTGWGIINSTRAMEALKGDWLHADRYKWRSGNIGDQYIDTANGTNGHFLGRDPATEQYMKENYMLLKKINYVANGEKPGFKEGMFRESTGKIAFQSANEASIETLSDAYSKWIANEKELSKVREEGSKKAREMENDLGNAREYSLQALMDTTKRGAILKDFNTFKQDQANEIWSDFKDRMASASERNGSYMGGTEGIKFAQESQQNAAKEAREHNKKMEDMENKMYEKTISTVDQLVLLRKELKEFYSQQRTEEASLAF